MSTPTLSSPNAKGLGTVGKVNNIGGSGSVSPIGGASTPPISGSLGSVSTVGVPSINLIVTPLVKNRVEIDFTTKASKEGLFSMWTTTSDKKITYTKDLTLKFDQQQQPEIQYNSQLLVGIEDGIHVFENIHYCLFFPLNTSVSTYRREVVQSMNSYFVQMISENPSTIKSILASVNEVFAYYLSIAKKEAESDSKTFELLALSLEKFLDETLNNLRDASQFSLSYLQKAFTNHLTAANSAPGHAMESALYNDNIQKFNYILSMAVDAVENLEKSNIIRAAMKLDSYQEKIAYIKAKSLSCKEFLLHQMKCRKIGIDANPFYSRSAFKSDKNFSAWKKQEEQLLQRVGQQIQPREDYLKSIWGIRQKDRDTLGVIAIKVVQARDLILKDNNTKLDPMVDVEFAGEKKRTKKASGVNPIFKEHFAFHITKSNLNSEIEFNIWDTKEKDHFLGKYKFTAKELIQFTKREVNWYQLQKRSSRSKISGDIRLQFHYLVFPDITNTPPNHVHYYRILLDRLLSYELRDQHTHISSPTMKSTTKKKLNIDPSKPSILSTQSTMLLKEYADRYGILDSTCKLMLLEHLTKIMIDYSALECIAEVRGLLIHIIDFKFGDIGLTIEEDKIFNSIIERLAPIFKHWLINFQSIFPQNNPPGALKMLIDIYYLFRTSELYELPPLSDLMKEVYQKRYKCATTLAESLTATQTQNTGGKAACLVRVCDILLFNLVEIDKKYYGRDFPSECNILMISIELYNSKLSEEIDELTSKGADNPQELSEFLELYFKLKELTVKFKDIYPKIELLPIPVLFKQCVMQWTLHSAGQLKALVDKLCKNEKWNPVSDDTLHSASVGELLLGCYHALDVIKSLRWEDLQKQHQNGQHILFEIFSNFTMVISETVIYYTNVIKNISLDALDAAAGDIFMLSDKLSPELIQTVQKVSLRFNNIQACLGHTEDLIAVLLRMMDNYKLSPSIVNEMSSQSYIAIQSNVRTLIDRIYDRLSPVIVGEIYRIVGLDPSDKTKNVVVDFFQKIEKNIDQLTQFNNQNTPIAIQLTPLLQYIASKLQLFSQYLYYPLTKQLLKRLWAGIIHVLDEMIFPTKKKNDFELTAQQLDLIDGMVKCFGEFFFVDGEGLTQKAIEKESERFMIILAAYREAIRSGVRDFDPLGLKQALKNINFANLKPDLTYLKKLNINLKEIPKQLDIFSLIKTSVEKRQKERKEREERAERKRSTRSIAGGGKAAIQKISSFLQVNKRATTQEPTQQHQ